MIIFWFSKNHYGKSFVKLLINYPMFCKWYKELLKSYSLKDRAYIKSMCFFYKFCASFINFVLLLLILKMTSRVPKPLISRFNLKIVQSNSMIN